MNMKTKGRIFRHSRQVLRIYLSYFVVQTIRRQGMPWIVDRQLDEKRRRRALRREPSRT
jgi:hypothetical protein